MKRRESFIALLLTIAGMLVTFALAIVPLRLVARPFASSLAPMVRLVFAVGVAIILLVIPGLLVIRFYVLPRSSGRRVRRAA